MSGMKEQLDETFGSHALGERCVHQVEALEVLLIIWSPAEERCK